MSYDKVKQANQLMIGTKQTKKAIEKGKAQEVIIARNADQRLIAEITPLCEKRKIAIVYVDSMKKLGHACGIEVGAATVAIVK